MSSPINTTTNTTAHIDPNSLHVSSAASGGVPSLGVNSNLQPSTATGTTGSTGTGVTGANSYQTSGSSPSATAGTTSSTGTTAKDTSSPDATGIRQRVNNLSAEADQKMKNASSTVSQSVNNASSQISQGVNNLSSQPAVQNAKGAAQKQVGQLREMLGRSPTIVNLEKRFGVDRVALVGGGILAYILLIPLNLFGLALPTTTLLTLLPPAFLALGILEQPSSNEANEAATKALLAYFVTLGFIQFLESAAAGLLERRIPQYYTVKLLVLAYLLHPRTQGAINLHNNVYRPLLARAQEAATPANTPPQSSSAKEGYNVSSPSTNASGRSTHSPEVGSNNPFAHPPSQSIGVDKQSIGFDSQGNITRNQAKGEGFSVVNELH